MFVFARETIGTELTFRVFFWLDNYQHTVHLVRLDGPFLEEKKMKKKLMCLALPRTRIFIFAKCAINAVSDCVTLADYALGVLMRIKWYIFKDLSVVYVTDEWKWLYCEARISVHVTESSLQRKMQRSKKTNPPRRTDSIQDQKWFFEDFL